MKLAKSYVTFLLALAIGWLGFITLGVSTRNSTSQSSHESTTAAIPSSTHSLSTPSDCGDHMALATNNVAPSYEVIQRTLWCIVGEDNKLSGEEKDSFYDYLASLSGKKAEGWKGRVISAQPDKPYLVSISETNFPALEFQVSLKMPSYNMRGDLRNYMDIILEDVPYEQVRDLRRWYEPLETQAPEQEVEFRGSILYMTDSNLLVIEHAQVKLLE